MAKYFQTAAGYVASDDDMEAQPGWTPITQAQYNALVEADQDAQQQAAANALAASRARWTQVRDDLVASGVTVATAEVLADAVGTRPAE